jgi:threonyl-tRNA synthetase
VGEDGKRHSPFLIHRAILGSLERFFGVLIEHYNGNFPVWLAPVQVIIIPVAERHNDYAVSLDKTFKENGLRSHADLRREKIGHKHTKGDRGEVVVNEFLEKVKELDKNRLLTVNL